MNNSLYRQIRAATKNFWKFQEKLDEIYKTTDWDSPHTRRVT